MLQMFFLDGLRAAGEPTRLRMLSLLREGELTVKDMTVLLGQSQPRISRHLKLLTEAGLIERYPEGAWVYYRLAEQGKAKEFANSLMSLMDPEDETCQRDKERLSDLRAAQAEQAKAYFAEKACEWDKVRSLHVPEKSVETAMLEMIRSKRIETCVDLGTGTGRMLDIFAPHYQRGIGVDTSHDMLRVARVNLDKAGVTHAQVRHGDLFSLSLPANHADLVVIHQVLHYMDDPAPVVKEAARILAPGGLLLVADFAPHALDYMREHYAHRRLGFSDEQMTGWFANAGLRAVQRQDLKAEVPDAQAERLTVSIWLAEDAREIVDAPVSIHNRSYSVA
jgi:ubiquinone/menaquinone biosynthesis C-methylase UbiE/DNA-binding HxlR family transcriptional regulator